MLTLQLVLSVPTLYLAEIGYLSFFQATGSDLGYFIIYFTYLSSALAFAAGYLYIRTPRAMLSIDTSVRSSYVLMLLFLLGGVALYWPIMKEFADDLFNPRRIYVATRSGYGLSYFGSMLLCYIFLVLALFHEKLSSISKLGALVITVVFAYLHGSKGQVIAAVFIWVYYYFVARQRQVKFRGFLIFALISFLLGGSLFYFMLDSVELTELFGIIAGYADYSRNAVMLVDNETVTYFGRLTLEDNIYSRVPRAIFPDKPKDFGAFLLSMKYFPQAFLLDEGVPSFGIGIYYADFSVFCIPFLAFCNFVGGVITRGFVTRLKIYRSPVDFLVVLFMSGITLLPIGSGYLLPEHFTISLGLLLCFKVLSLNFTRQAKPLKTQAEYG
ncbi:hypothetical protein [Massilia sp. LjRoot122]|uniref:hypothetical protein n=1 Tax=Massilia sp. LjRoot122 TaxID=3342257 RepID=UPI003ECE7AD0